MSFGIKDQRPKKILFIKVISDIKILMEVNKSKEKLNSSHFSSVKLE